MGWVKIFVFFIVYVYGHEHVHGVDEFYLLLGVTPKPGPLGPDIYSEPFSAKTDSILEIKRLMATGFFPP